MEKEKQLDNRILNLKLNREEFEKTVYASIKILHPDNTNSVNYSKWIKHLLGQHYSSYKNGEITDISYYATKLLEKIVIEGNEEESNYVLSQMKDNHLDDLLKSIETLKQNRERKELFYYFSLNGLAILLSFVIHYFDFNEMEFVPIVTQIFLIMISLIVNVEHRIKSGLVFALINFIFIYPTRQMFTEYKYSLIVYLIISLVIMGQIVAFSPKYLCRFLKNKLKDEYALYATTIGISYFFTLLLTLSNMYYTKQANLNYSFNLLYKLIQPILVGVICVQMRELIINEKDGS